MVVPHTYTFFTLKVHTIFNIATGLKMLNASLGFLWEKIAGRLPKNLVSLNLKKKFNTPLQILFSKIPDELF